MTLSSIITRVSYVGNGSTTVFSYADIGKIFDDDDLKVYVDDVLKTKTTHYTVSGVGDAGGGDITFLTAPANLAEVLIRRDQPLTQDLDLITNGRSEERRV